MSVLIKETQAKEHRSRQQRCTIEEFEQQFAATENGERLLELIHGEIVKKMLTEEHGVVGGNIFAPLHNFVTPRRLGRVGFEIRHRPEGDLHNSRLPDISFSSARRPIVTRGSVPDMPDLAIEVRSPTDSIKSMREKATYYLENGAKMVWLIYPRKQIVEVYYADGEIDILHPSDTLSGEDVLPGFTLPVLDIFADPFAE